MSEPTINDVLTFVRAIVREFPGTDASVSLAIGANREGLNDHVHFMPPYGAGAEQGSHLRIARALLSRSVEEFRISEVGAGLHVEGVTADGIRFMVILDRTEAVSLGLCPPGMKTWRAAKPRELAS